MKKLRIYYNGKVHEIGVEEINDEISAPSLDKAQLPQSAPNLIKPDNTAVSASSAGAGEAVEVPMPGIIVRIDVKVGQPVKSGDTLMILEAMKLENAIYCETTGVVKELRVETGDMVDAGDVVAVIA